jgi:hypothetical protein
MASTAIHKFFSESVAANDQSSVLEQLDGSLRGVQENLALLNTAQDKFNETLATSVQAQTASSEALTTFLTKQTEVLIKVVSEKPQPIPLETADDNCIQDSFTFMRTLNEIESLVTDSKFNELKKKKNSETLAGIQNTALYKGCIAILDQKMLNAQPVDDEGNRFKEEFTALFVDIQDDLGDRAKHLIAIHQFRDRILHFFADQCHDVAHEPAINAPS